MQQTFLEGTSWEAKGTFIDH